MGSDPKTAPLQFRAAIALSACQRGDHLHQILMSIAGLIQKKPMCIEKVSLIKE